MQHMPVVTLSLTLTPVPRRYDVGLAEILLKLVLNNNQSINH